MKHLLGVLLTFALATSAWGAPVLKFDDPIAPGGNVSYSGTLGDPIVGTSIPFQTITGLDTPLNSGVTLSCVGCLYNFETGGVTSEGPTTWEAAGGGFVRITGSIPALALPAGTLLASGDFSDVLNPEVNASGDSGEFSGFGFDTKHISLAEFYGLGPNFVFLSTEIALTTTRIGAEGDFSAIPNNSDFNNAALPVAAPASLLLLGVGILGSTLIFRRTR